MFSIGLRVHAAVISVSLLFLASLLGFKAYFASHTHFQELQALVRHDSRVQELLGRLETGAGSLDQARRKHRITKDPAYRVLADRQRQTMLEDSAALRSELQVLYPDLSPGDLTQARAVRKLQESVARKRQDRLGHAHEAALGLARLVTAALVVSIGITAWLLHFFYRGMLQPLRELKESTERIRSGELSHRTSIRRGLFGVLELDELSRSFNAMAGRLESLDRAKSEFLATVSHEIKNPLAALKEGMSLLSTKMGEMSEDARARTFAACLIASKRLEVMINNLLGHSKMEAGLFQFDMSVKDLGEAIQSVVQEVGPMARRRQMEIRYTGPRAIAASFNWDGMVQVLENILVNAIKYGDEGSTIDVAAAERESGGGRLSEVELSVTNRGKGIPESDIGRVFERFYRSSQAKAAQSGLGLGLHVVQRVVEAHHGVVAASSADGETRIQVRFPRMYQTEARAEAQA